MFTLFKLPGLFLPERSKLVGLLTKLQKPTFRTVTAATALTAGDENALIRINMAGANALTVPLNATVAFDIGIVVHVRLVGAGATTITPATGAVTLNTPAGKTLVVTGAGKEFTLRKVGTNEWDVYGDLTAA